MNDLIAWLRQQLDTDEQTAVRAGGSEWEVGPAFGARENMVRIREQGVLVDSVGSCAESWAFVGQVASIPNWRENAQHIATHDPARVLRQVAAQRSILNLCAAAMDAGQIKPGTTWNDDAAGAEVAEATVRLLGEVYRDRPGYREEWRP